MSKADMHIEGNEELIYLKEKRQKLVERIEDRCIVQDELIYTLDKLVPNLVSSLDLSQRVISAFNGGDPNRRVRPHKRHHGGSDSHTRDALSAKVSGSGVGATGGVLNSEDRNGVSRMDYVNGSEEADIRSRLLRLDDKHEYDNGGDSLREGNNDASGSHPKALSTVKVMVAAVLLDRTPFLSIDSAAILRKLENGYCTPADKNTLVELGGEVGAIAAVEMALKAFADENAGVELEEFAVSGKTRIMVLGIDRTRLAKVLPETAQQLNTKNTDNSNGMGAVPVLGTSGGMDLSRAPAGMNSGMPRPDMWAVSGEPHPQGVHGMPVAGPPMFPGSNPPQMMGPRGVHRPMALMGMPGPGGVPGQGMGFNGHPAMQRPPIGPSPGLVPPPLSSKPRTEEDDIKDIEALLKKKSFRELQKSKTGEELYDLIHRPTARETALAAKFKTKGGTQLKEYCKALTKEDCRRQRCSYIACEKVHFRRIIATHTDVSLGDCSFLDTCRHMKTCKYVHYELDSSPDVHTPGMVGLPPPKPLRAEYCSEVELGEPQWINCDIRNFRMDILGQFGVIMADPPWDIHMELPYGTMADDEMRNLNVPTLQTDGLIFLWVTGRAMELGRECLELWGYRRIEELIWVKTNQLQRIIRTGRTGHWLNHSKEHCLVGIKGDPEVNRNIDTDVLVSEVRETSRKPDEMYPMLERISPRTRKLELFARMHNTHAGWMSLGNQLNGVRLVDEGLRARFKAAYSDVEVQPASPPRAAPVSDGEATAQAKNRFSGMEAKVTPEHMPMTGSENYASEEKFVAKDSEMIT
uniref:N6-adenosine-methyltransferase MT-A70-like n=1 Tax=Picea sitchensis TaxID=3332 RepID=B8LPF6_PICSI|nr:unknown [Picea sitchensis]